VKQKAALSPRLGQFGSNWVNRFFCVLSFSFSCYFLLLACVYNCSIHFVLVAWLPLAPHIKFIIGVIFHRIHNKYIDLYYQHRIDTSVLIEDTVKDISSYYTTTRYIYMLILTDMVTLFVWESHVIWDMTVKYAYKLVCRVVYIPIQFVRLFGLFRYIRC